jgi:cyclopropane fatty-acyl-phospholipid synthase-like methyltransferase
MELANYTNCNQDYYQRLHDEHPAFQQNNWMLSELETLKLYQARSVVEIGCGNGKFLSAASPHFEHITGIDWARAPAMDGILKEHANTAFIQADLIGSFPETPDFDLLLSADFLEHLPTDSLRDAIGRYHRKARFHFHKIACYDDGHSHLSILDPVDWLDLFKSISPDYTIFSLEKRNGDSTKLVCCITNHNPHDTFARATAHRLSAIEHSRSWRITYPYRYFMSRLKGQVTKS